MNLRLILLLVAGILAAHALLIHLLLKTSTSAGEAAARALEQVKEEEIDNTAKESGNEDDAESDADPLAPDADVLATIREMTAPPPADEKIRTEVRPWRPLDYGPSGKGRTELAGAAKHIRSGILVDVDTRQVLWSIRPDTRVPIASMSKIMTLMTAYETATTPGSGWTLKSIIPVTREASQVPPSKVNLRPGEKITLESLMVAASVKSANDAAYLIAQALGGGDVNKFLDRMNKRAEELGMKDTHFFNPHGLPGANRKLDNFSTPEDLVRLCEVFMTYPQLKRWSALRAADFRSPGTKGYLKLYNHNNLLPGSKYGSKGVDGIKTGYTNRAGFCIALSCTRNGRTLLAIVTGGVSLKDRDQFARKLLDWGYRQKSGR